MPPTLRSVAQSSPVQVFENHAPAQRMLLALGVLTVMEAVPVHFLLQAWKPAVAWSVLALTLYSLYWIAGVYRALAARPHVLSAERLLLRVGLFYTVDVDRATITRIAPYRADAPQPGVVALKFITSPNVELELSTPVQVKARFGRTQSATRLAFYAQHPERLFQLQAQARRDPQQQQ
jgi:hypothetical protein